MSQHPRPSQRTGVHAEEVRENRALPLATLTALGVVFGDLGTSPLYTLQTVFQATGHGVDGATALGVLSLIFWTLLVTISVKYALFVMRADNHGEGGILALMSLVGVSDWRKGTYAGAAMGLLGACLIYGDGVITPAISVLSAVEGVKVATPALERYVLPIAVAILVALFAVQRFGTARIGRAFGPVMLVWFVVIGALGLLQVVQRPQVLAAVSPTYAIAFLIHSGPAAMLVLGGVFLCATGGEALYADMGHVGRGPIRLAWYALVLPALLLSYAGQTAAVLARGGVGGANPFFLIAPQAMLFPMVGLATLATIIASQAIITGSFSMTRQAMQLGWLPLFSLRQTSTESYGQIYVPVVNWMMAAATLAITLAFRSSDRLAGAYGTAVSTTMLLTTLLLYRAMGRVWRWPAAAVLAVTAVFLVVDAAFFSANLLKLLEGGYIPLTLGAMIFLIMITWRQGIQRVRARLVGDAPPIDTFLEELRAKEVVRPHGVAAFLTRVGDGTPPLMRDYVRITGSLPRTVVALSLSFEETPRVPPERRADFERLAADVWRVRLRYGFMENPDLGAGLADLTEFGEKVDLKQALFFGTRDFITCTGRSGMARWRTELFSFLFRNGVRIVDRFNLPADRTIEIAREIKI
jgi:KUP system potassium uptake protein